MKTRKIAVVLPQNLLATIDAMCRKQGLSRSRLISKILSEKVREENKRDLKEAYDAVFSNESIRREQLETSNWLESGGIEDGQDW